MSGEVSARPERLHEWATAAVEIREALQGRIQALTTSYFDFQSSGGSYPVANPHLMGDAIPALLSRYSTIETFVETVGRAFDAAGNGGLGSTGPDGTVTVPGGAFNDQFEATALALGLDPAALLAANVPITVDDPIAAGVPRTSGFVADPVCTATGHMLEQEDDLIWPARLAVLAMRRTYSSRFVGDGPLGRGWASWANTLCVRTDDGHVAYHGPDGQLAVVPRVAPADANGNGDRPAEAWATLPGLLATIEAADGGGLTVVWELHSAHPGERWHFDADGLLRTVEGVNIGVATFTYTDGLLTAITHDGGRSVELTWDGARITALTSSDGRTVTFVYDDGDLALVQRPSGGCRYVTDERGLLVEAWDADEVRLCFNTYDDEGRVTSQVSPFGRTTTFEYQPGRRTVVADTEGGPAATFEHDAAGRLIGLVDDDGNRMSRRFDPAGHCTTAAGFDGGQTTRQLDEHGRVTSVEGPGGTETFAYDEQGRLTEHGGTGPAMRFDYGDDPDSPTPVAIEGPEGWRMLLERDALGQIARLEDADGVAVTIERDADGNVVAVSNGIGAVTRYRHHPTGQPVEVIAPDGAITTIEVDDAGRPLAMTNPAGDTWRMEWSAAGRPLATVDPAGHRTELAYASHGNVERVTDAEGGTVELVHDHLQRLVRIVCADGAKWELDHTATGQLAVLADPTGATRRFDYDPEGRLVGVTDAMGGRARFRYDEAGRLLSETDRTGATSSVVRDATGNVVASTDAAGATTTVARDAWGRPTELVDPDGVTLRYTYTAAGRVASVRTGSGGGHDVTHDAAGRTVAFTQVDGGTTTLAWDDCDRLVSVTHPSGRTEDYRYDAAGRRVETRLGEARWTSAFDAAGRLVELTDPTGAVTRYAYDGRGKLVSATDPNGGTIRVRYDVRGNPVAVVDQRGSTWGAAFDANRRLASRTDPLGRTIAFDRDLNGGVTAAGRDGERTTYRRDAEGRITDIAVDGREMLVWVRDPSGRPTLVHEPESGRTHTLTWTPGGRLAAIDADGRRTSWERDADGSIIAFTAADGGTTRYERDRRGLVTSSTSGAGTTRFERDLDGYLTGVSGDGVERAWEYDDAGRAVGYRVTVDGAARSARIVRDAAGRVTAIEADTSTSRYHYDAAGQLVGAATAEGTWTFRYDEAGRLVGEDGPDGTRTFVYDDAHQLERIDGPAGTTELTYDAAGRRIAEDGPAGPVRYQWDGLGRLRAVERSGGRHELDVDATGVLAGVDGTPLDWDRSRPAETMVADEADEAAEGEDGDRDGRPAADWRDSHVVTDPWGAHLEPDADLHRVGPGAFGELEVAGLLWLRNRAYDPATRQFLSPDPLTGVPGTPYATHPYHYAGNDPVGHADPLGRAPISIEAYNEIREQETGMQWGNIALVGLTAASFFIPGGPLVATLVGAGLGMAPGIIQGIQTGEWDAGAIVAGGILGAAGGRLGFQFGAGATSLTSATLRGMGAGAITGTGTQLYDLTGLPGADGTFDVERIALDTAVGGVGGHIGYRINPPHGPVDGPGAADIPGDGARFVTDSNGVTIDLRAPAPPPQGGAGPVRQGQAGVDRTVADLETAGGRVLGREVTVEAGGVRTRPDLYVELPNGQQAFLEVKTGPNADLTTNQSTAFPDIRAGGAIPRGANAQAAGLAPGTPMPPTQVWVVHQPWPLGPPL